jgi:acyl-ACP thioesterase
MFTFDSKVLYSKISPNEKLSIKALVDYFQDCSTLQSETLEKGLKFLQDNHRAWLLSSWQIDIVDMPDYNDDITIGTQVSNINGLLSNRNFAIYNRSKDGKLAVKADSVWFLLNTDTRMPVKIEPPFSDIYEICPPLEMELLPRKIRPIKNFSEASFLGVLPVNPSMIDTNGHMNNAQYIAVAEAYLPATDKEIKRIHAYYANSAVKGDELNIYSVIDNDSVKIGLLDSSEKHAPYAYVQFYY